MANGTKATAGGILLSMATANVRSLEPAELRLAQRAGLRTNLKIEVLDRDFHDAGFHIVCVQESAIRSSVTRKQRYYTAYTCAANDAGQLGVEIWVCNSLLVSCKVRAIPVSPRLMSILIDGSIRAKITCAHAPTEVADADDITDLWSFLTSTWLLPLVRGGTS